MNRSYKDLNILEPILETNPLENYSGIFDPEILRILNPNSRIPMKKIEETVTRKEENAMNTSIYSFVDNNSHPPSREFRCSRHFMDFEGKIMKNIRKNRKPINRRYRSYQGFDRKERKLEKIMRKLSLGNVFLSGEAINKMEIKEKLKKDAGEINRKLNEKKVFTKKKTSFRNFDNMLRNLKEDEILKIINSIEGIITQEGTKENIDKAKWKPALKS